MRLFSRIYYFIFFFGLSFPFSLCAQHSSLHFYHLTTADGLSDNSVNDICQDHEGFLWFATRNGLNRYDGKHFVVFRHSFFDSASINNNLIFHVIADTADNIWFTTFYGVSCLDRETGKFINYYYKKNDGSIVTTPQLFNAVGVLPTGGVIVFSPYYGFFSIDKLHNKLVPKYFSQIPADVNYSNQFLTSTGCVGYKTDSSFYISEDGGKHFQNQLNKKLVPADIPVFNFMLATTSGATSCFATTGADDPVTIITTDTLTKELHIQTLPSKIMMAMNKYSANTYWMGFWGAGLTEYNSSTGKIISYLHYNKDANTLSSDLVRAMFTDKDKNLWIATEEGINYCNPEKDKVYTVNNDVAGFENMHIGSVEAMAEDSSGKIWIGILDYNTGAKNGLIYFDPSSFKYEHFFENGNSSNEIWKILPEKDNLLLSTQIGLYQFDQKTKSLNRNFKYHFPDDVINFKKGIPILQKDKKGNYWFGLWRKGLIKFNPKTNQSVYFSSHAPNPDLRLNDDLVVSLAEDDNDKIWVINWINNVMECIDNTSNKITHIPLEINGQIFTDKLENIVADHYGHVWIGTAGGGLIRFDTQSRNIKLFSVNDGLPDESIHALCFDNKNRLWVYTSKGLVWIDPKQGDVHAIDNDVFRFSDSYSDQAMILSNEGNMYLSNQQNLFFFNPNDIVLQQQVKPPVLTSIHKMDRTFYAMPSQKEIEILPGEDFLSFDFVSIDMMHSRQINYAYRLKGYNDLWQEAGNEGVAKFTKLPPGNYELQMRATFQGIAWDGKYTSVLLKVVPAFYQTWWFATLLLLLAVALLGYFIYYISTSRLRKKLSLLKQQQQIDILRNRIAGDIHDDIGAGLTKISIRSELAKQKKEATEKDYLDAIENINRQSHELVNSLGEIVWTINPQYDRLESMLAYFRHYIHHFLENMPLHYTIHFPDSVNDDIIHPDIKRNLFLILKEALNNAVKHSNADKLDILFEINQYHYTMRVADNGTGINDKTGNQFGNGIKGMQNRASQIKAELQIDSQQNNGTVILIKGDFYNPV